MKIVLADDHGLIRELVAKAVKALDDNVEVLHAEDVARALELAAGEKSIDIVVMDLRMPGMNGLTGLRQMLQLRPDVPVVILSGEKDPEMIRAALNAGASGFIPKTTRVAAMVNALRMILSGDRYVPFDVLVPGVQSDPGAAPGLDSLTPRELDILKNLVKGQSNKEIGKLLGLEEVTVAAHLRSIFKKLDVRNRTQAVRVATLVGFGT